MKQKHIFSIMSAILIYLLINFSPMYAAENMIKLDTKLKFRFISSDHKWSAESSVLKEKSNKLMLKISQLKTILLQKEIFQPVHIKLLTPEMEEICNFGSLYINKKADDIFNNPEKKEVKINRYSINSMIAEKIKKQLSVKGDHICILEIKNPSEKISHTYKIAVSFPFKDNNREFIDIYRFFLERDFIRAEQYSDNLKENRKLYSYSLLGELCFRSSDIKNAAKYYEKSSDRKGLNKIGLFYFNQDKFLSALEYFEKAGNSIYRARAYKRYADLCFKDNKTKETAAYYKKALKMYETMLKNYHFTLKPGDNRERLECIKRLSALPVSAEEKQKQETLKRILKKAAIYCNNLENKFQYFYCHEHIKEYSNQTKETNSRKYYKKFLYDYQIVKDKDKTKEQRILLKENGNRKYKKDAELMTILIYKNLIFGPIAFLNKQWQNYYYYRIIEEKSFNGKTTFIIEALLEDISIKNNSVAGKIWITEGKGSFDIDRLVWNAKGFMRDLKQLVELESLYKGILNIKLVSELQVKQRGYSLPSRYFLEVSYIDTEGKKFTRSKLEAQFKKHQFFNVKAKKIIAF